RVPSDSQCSELVNMVTAHCLCPNGRLQIRTLRKCPIVGVLPVVKSIGPNWSVLMPWLEILGDERVENRLIFHSSRPRKILILEKTGLEALPPFRKGVREWLVFLRLTQLSLQVDGSKRG